ncbi:MAG: carbamoyl-phosphate synthase large subunit [Verrucomicrobia bacterium]|nr:carbamoyl-phosphate synthase large subunit [Verrucomicrobiota bacterium]
MPKRCDLTHILLIGSGPIVIGQGCEFDYAGTQACQVLRQEGYRVTLINSNPATIMTDPQMADRVYFEPLTREFVEQIIEVERPDAVLVTMGGQTALNLALQLRGIELLGTTAEAIQIAEDRALFRQTAIRLGLDLPRSNLKKPIDFPVMVRASYELGGSGSGIAHNEEELIRLCSGGREILIDEALVGWKEFEMEVIRDQADNCIVVCCIENIDPLGIHTGDSITVTPPQTLTDKEYQKMRDAAFALVRAIQICGGANVQFAIDPKTGRMVVIEMNPRVSRSSALASKATGFPIAKVATKLAIGYTLAEVGVLFEPTIDYVVVKIPRFNFEKFKGADSRLGTQMRSVGEAMAIGGTLREAVDKAMRSMELPLPIEHTGLEPGPYRLWAILAALQNGMSIQQIYETTHIDPWFLSQMKTAKHPSQLVYKRIDSCAGEFSTSMACLYATQGEECEACPSNRKKILILGSGPIRIGQGIEFDYCCVHAALAFKELGFETIMVNCNPAAVSTDLSFADKLYLSPMTIEDILPICAIEKPLGVVVQYGGQTPLNLAKDLQKAGIPLLGLSFEQIEIAENRAKFRQFIQGLGLNHPAIYSNEFPVILRPSYVLGGQSMRIVYAAEEGLGDAEQFLVDAIEVDIDAISDGYEVFIPGIMEHVEPAGIHSGDSACCVPPFSLSEHLQEKLREQTKKIALGLKIVGLINVQFAIQGETIYVLEVNPRASRTCPFLSKATGIDLVRLATFCLMGIPLKEKSPQLRFFAVKEAVLPLLQFPNLELGPEMRSTGEVMGLGSSFDEAYDKARMAAGAIKRYKRQANKNDCILNKLERRLGYLSDGTGLHLTDIRSTPPRIV